MTNYNQIMKDYTILESDRLILRPFCMEDVEDVFLYASDDIVTEYLIWSAHEDIQESERVVKDFYMNKEGIFAIELKLENRCIGCIDLRICHENDKASFGYVLNRQYWNKGYMSEALNQILDLAFSKLKLNRVESTYYVGNEGSRRVMEKCGMKHEGTGIQESKTRGKYFDVAHYAILREEWTD